MGRSATMAMIVLTVVAGVAGCSSAARQGVQSPSESAQPSEATYTFESLLEDGADTIVMVGTDLPAGTYESTFDAEPGVSCSWTQFYLVDGEVKGSESGSGVVLDPTTATTTVDMHDGWVFSSVNCGPWVSASDPG